MSLVKATAAAGLLLLLLGTSGAAAGARPIEVGMDGSAEILMQDGDTFSDVNLPGGGGPLSFDTGFRIAFAASDRVQFEPAMGLSHSDATLDGDSFTNARLAATVVINSGPYDQGTSTYLRLGGKARFSDTARGSVLHTQFAVLGGFGVRSPVSGPVFTRMEICYSHAFANEGAKLETANILDLKVGLSVFVR